MIYLTADLHGDIERLKFAGRRLKRKDTLIVLGDFGFLWNGGTEEASILKWIGRRKYTVLFLDGTHENFDILKAYPIENYLGGKTQLISGKLRRLMRGEVFTIEGKNILAFGGGTSNDRDVCDESNCWWPAELPSEEEVENARVNLDKNNNKVDFILTHDVPSRLLMFMNLNETGLCETSSLQMFFDELTTLATYTHWYFGCHHRDLAISQKHTAVYKKVLQLYQLPAKK